MELEIQVTSVALLTPTQRLL